MDTVKVSGSYQILHNGKVIREGKNLVVNVGLGLIATLLSGAGTAPTKMAVGDDDTLPTGADTTLGNELHRVAVSSVVSANGITFTATFTGQNSGTETPAEFGIFNANSGGDMLSRFTCPTFDWAMAEALVVNWSINIGELA